MSTIHVAVRGHVQGVGFRWFVREQARALGLTGWVRNNADGSVEVFAIGSASAVEELRRLLHRGPAGARVRSLAEQKEPPGMDAMDPFGIIK